MADRMRTSEAESLHAPGARVGEPVWVLLNHVKADRREQFERFVCEALRPAAERLAPAIAARVRVLAPTQANDDGTHTYVMLLDPVLAGEDYGLAPLLERAYGAARGREHRRRRQRVVERPQVRHELAQSPWAGTPHGREQ